MTASQFYAEVHGETLSHDLPDQCYWCGAPCDRSWPKEEPPPTPFTQKHRTALRPGNSYVCVGCLMYRRARQTVRILGGGYKDRQCFLNHSWILNSSGIWAITEDSLSAFHKMMMKPPLKFVLAIIDGDCQNLVQLAKVNDLAEIKADTELWFTMNNTPLAFTVYELEYAAETGESSGMRAGTRELVRLFGPFPSADAAARVRGRPTVDEEKDRLQKINRQVRKSG